MYAQVEKTKRNSFPRNRQESRAFANSVTQKKNNEKKGFGVRDNQQLQIPNFISNRSSVFQLAINHAQSGNVDTYSGKRKDFWKIGSEPYQNPTNTYVPKKYKAEYDVNGNTGQSGWYQNPAEVFWDRGHKLAKNTGGDGYGDNLFWQNPETNRGTWRTFENTFDTALGVAANNDPVTFTFERSGSIGWDVKQW